MDYENLLTEERRKLQDAVLADLSSDFDWEQLIILILEEESPLQDLFSEQTLQLAEVCQHAERYVQAAKHLEEMKDD